MLVYDSLIKKWPDTVEENLIHEECCLPKACPVQHVLAHMSHD